MSANVVNIRDYKLSKSMYRILRVWDERANDPCYSPQHRMIARKLAKTYREALEELKVVNCKHDLQAVLR